MHPMLYWLLSVVWHKVVFMHPMLYCLTSPSPPGLTHVELMHPMLYCFDVPEPSCVLVLVHVEP
jgi:hypothetical protein